MQVIARIRFEGGLLMLPSRTPYDVETLLEHLDWYAGRHHDVQLEIDRHHWRVERGGAEDGECMQCRAARPALTFVNGRRVPLCSGCARSAVSSRFAHWPPEAVRRAHAG
jgi:hypothetical protein